MLLDDALDDGQAEAGPGSLPGIRRVDLLEPVEDALLHADGNAAPTVGDGQLQAVVADSHTYVDHLPGQRALDGVGQQVGQSLDDPVAADPDQPVYVRYANRHGAA